MFWLFNSEDIQGYKSFPLLDQDRAWKDSFHTLNQKGPGEGSRRKPLMKGRPRKGNLPISLGRLTIKIIRFPEKQYEASSWGL